MGDDLDLPPSLIETGFQGFEWDLDEANVNAPSYAMVLNWSVSKPSKPGDKTIRFEINDAVCKGTIEYGKGGKCIVPLEDRARWILARAFLSAHDSDEVIQRDAKLACTNNRR